MDGQELDILLREGEGTRLEYKRSEQSMPSDLFETVCAFLNKEGGTVLLGVDNDGIVRGVDAGKLSQIKADIITSSNNGEVLRPPFTLSPQDIARDGKTLLYLKIPVSSQVHYHGNIIYDRENESDLKITDHARIDEIYFRKRTLFSDSIVYPALDMDDFNSALFDRARALIHSKDPVHPWLGEDDRGLLRMSNLFRKDYRTGEEGFTLASALIFGKDEVIQDILPAYKIEAIVRIENLDRWDDRLTLRTNLIDTYQALMNFVKNHLPSKFFIVEGQRQDLRELVFREIVANIIVHREYTNSESTQFVVHRENVVATNPNKPHFRGTLLLDEYRPFPKNPLVSKFFMELGWVEEIGSGVKNLFKYLPIYVEGARPLLIENDVFRSTITLVPTFIGGKYDLLLEFLGVEAESLEPEQLSTLMKIQLPPNLVNIEDEDRFLFELVSSWITKGTKFKELRLPTSDEALDFNKWRIPSLGQKGTKLFGKRFITLMKILIGVLVPRSMEQLMNFMQYKNRKTFRDLYINPLLISDLVKRTIPEKPRDPNQRYVISEKGKYFLGGFEL